MDYLTQKEAQGGRSIGQTTSRIDNDVEFVKASIGRIENTTERIVRHARTLGYYEPQKDAQAAAPTPVTTTLADALRALDRAIDHCSGALDRAIDHCSGALNVFD